MKTRATTIGEMVEEGTLVINDGHRMESSELVDSGGLPFVRGGDVTKGRIDFDEVDHIDEELRSSFGNKVSQDGDVVITTKGSVGRFAYVRPNYPEFVYSPQLSFWRVKDDSEVLPRYLWQWARSPEFKKQLGMYKGQTTMADYISLEDQQKVEIDLPPLPVQRRLADILGALDDKIELNRRMNETLEEMAQTLYRHWFVDFGPFQDREFRDTEELGPIPKGWEVTAVGNTTHINLGQSPKSKYYNEEGDGLVFHQGVSTYGWRFPVHERYCSKKKRVADDGDILISVRAPVGRLNIADRKLIIGRGLTALRREDGNQSFLFYFLKEFFDEENKIGSGTVFNSITKSVLNDLEMIGPPPEVIEEFESIVRPMDEQIRNNHEENKTLAETRDYLLPKLISGKIEVEAAEEVAEDTVEKIA